MNLDEFAFFNQQLAGMLRSGIPLEGALRQLAGTMHRGALRTELEQLQADLAQGIPLRDALPRRQLPPLYAQMVQIGTAGHNLPGMLTLLADYYQRRHLVWTKLKALMIYPAVVLVACLGVSFLLGWFSTVYTESAYAILSDIHEGRPLPAFSQLGNAGLMWLPTVWLLLIFLTVGLGTMVPACRDWVRWHLPGFREASLSQLAGTLRLLLADGGDLGRSLKLMRELEGNTALGGELAEWEGKLAAGMGRFAEMAKGSRCVPPLFIWLVAQGGEELATGFARAAEIYQERARHKVEMMLYAALPVAVLILGGLIFMQLFTMLRVMGGIVGLVDSLGAS